MRFLLGENPQMINDIRHMVSKCQFPERARITDIAGVSFWLLELKHLREEGGCFQLMVLEVPGVRSAGSLIWCLMEADKKQNT